MGRVVSLAAHRNTKDARDRKKIARQMVTAAKELNSDKQVRGYVLVAWKDEFDGRADWHLDKVESSRSTPERVKQILIDAFNKNAED